MSYRNRKETIKAMGIILLLSILLVFLSSYFTYEIMYSKANLNSEEFSGTYCVEIKNSEEYLCIMNSVDDNLKDTYVQYDIYDNLKKSGKCKKTNSNYVTLSDDANGDIATLIYLSEKFYLIQDGEAPISITKVSDDIIVPEKLSE